MQATGSAAAAAPASHKKFYHHLYFQVLGAIVLGVLLGYFYPQLGESMKWLGDLFIKLIKMLIAPIIFCTVVHGIASMEDMKKVGRVGVKALIYFEVMTTLALIIGLVVVNLWQPGAGMNVDVASLDTKAIAAYTSKAAEQGTIAYIMHIVPSTVVGAFAEGEILQVLFIALLFGFALFSLGERGKPLLGIIDQTAHVFFKIVGIVMKVAPIGAFGAMAFTIGKYGVGSLLSLGQLMLAFYATCLLFIFLVLGTVARLAGFSIVKFIKYIKEELLIVLGTSSSEIGPAAHDRQDGEPGLPEVGRRARHSDRLLVQPRRHLHLPDDGRDLPGAGDQRRSHPQPGDRHHRRPAADLQGRRRRHRLRLHRAGRDAGLASATIPVASIALILGVDRFMSEARALTNLIGNGVATVVVAKWEGALDVDRMNRHLNNETDAEADNPESVLVTEEEQAGIGVGQTSGARA